MVRDPRAPRSARVARTLVLASALIFGVLVAVVGYLVVLDLRRGAGWLLLGHLALLLLWLGLLALSVAIARSSRPHHLGD